MAKKKIAAFKPAKKTTAQWTPPKPQVAKGQSFTPTKTPRPAGLGKQLQPSYGTAPSLGPAQSVSPPAQPAPSPQPLGLDPAYLAQVGQIQSNYWNTRGQTEYQRGRTRFEYGFDDTSNPFNRKTMLQRAYEQTQRGNMARQASRGHLYSGGAQAEQDEGNFQQGRNLDTLRQQYADLLNDLLQQEATAANVAKQDWTVAYSDMLNRQVP